METYVGKPQENATHVSGSVYKESDRTNPAYSFADNRPEAVAQRKLQEIANNSLQGQHIAVAEGRQRFYITTDYSEKGKQNGIAGSAQTRGAARLGCSP